MKVLGFLYFLFSFFLLITLGIMITYSAKNSHGDIGFIFLIIPLLGMPAGHFMRTGKYNLIKIIIILFSLISTISILFIYFFVTPKLQEIKAANTNLELKIKPPLDENTKEMFEALYGNDLYLFKEVLDKGVDVNARNETNETPLHIAKDKEIIKLLIKNGADVNALDDYNMTPIFNKEVELSKILIEAGTDINVRSKEGNTALLWYGYSGYIEGIKYLISLGANVNDKNSDGRTVYDIAETFRYLQLLEYLKSVGAKSGKELK